MSEVMCWFYVEFKICSVSVGKQHERQEEEIQLDAGGNP